jgi:hypothetical protein
MEMSEIRAITGFPEAIWGLEDLIPKLEEIGKEILGDAVE